MDIIADKMTELWELRKRRLANVNESIGDDDSNPINCWIADMINRLENMYVLMNTPEDGFHSLTPKKEE